jgi:glycosyltransferase involved in cell wall biosynthesis
VNALDVPADLKPGFENLSDGIDTDFFSRAHLKGTPRQTTRPVLFLPARITREKGQLDLLRVLRALVKEGLDCEVALAGRVDASAFPEELKAYALRHGLASRVRFLGDLGLEDLRRAYADATLVVFPTYHCEGLGRITLESQAMGTPALAYGTGGVAEGIDDGLTGYVVPTGDIRALTARTAHLLRHPAERDRLGAAGRRMVVDRFSLSRLAERHESYYQRIIAGGVGALLESP